MTKRTTFLVIDSERPISPGETAQIAGRSQIVIHPHRLRVEPEIAPFFLIEDVRVGCLSLFPRGQNSVPATQFSVGLGDGLDAGELALGVDLTMVVRNVSHLVPGDPILPCKVHADPSCRSAHCPIFPGRLGASLPFRATWAAIVVPPRARSTNDDLGGPGRSGQAGEEDLGTRIDRVQETIGSPRLIVREHPGFGWDPNGEG